MGRTLHNVKASLMLCFWLYEPRKFIKLIRNNVGSECLRVWHNYIPGCVARVYYIILYPHAHFSRRLVLHTSVGIALLRSSAKVFLGPIQRTSRSGYPPFCYVVTKLFNKMPYWVSIGCITTYETL